MRLDMARVQAALRHQLLLFAEVVLGIGQQAGVDIGQQRLAVAGRREQRLVQLVEQIHQRMVLRIHHIQAGDKAIIPNERGIHTPSNDCLTKDKVYGIWSAIA